MAENRYQDLLNFVSLWDKPRTQDYKKSLRSDVTMRTGSWQDTLNYLMPIINKGTKGGYVSAKFTADGTTQTIVVFGFAPIKFLQIAYTDGSSNAQSIQVIKTSTGSFDYFVSNAIPELDAVTLLTGDDAGKFSFNTGGYSGLVMHFVAFGDWTT